MRKIIFLICASIGIKVNAEVEKFRYVNCEERLNNEKIEKKEISNLFLKAMTGTNEDLSVREKKLIIDLMNKSKLEEMKESHECEITN